jgi:hypothetical protein
MDGPRWQHNQDTCIQHARGIVVRTVPRADTTVHKWLASRPIPKHVLQGREFSFSLLLVLSLRTTA